MWSAPILLNRWVRTSTFITVSLTPLSEISMPALRNLPTIKDNVSSPEASMSLMPLATMSTCLRVVLHSIMSEILSSR